MNFGIPKTNNDLGPQGKPCNVCSNPASAPDLPPEARSPRSTVLRQKMALKKASDLVI